MLSKRIGCCLGKIAQVTYSQTSYIIKFESDDEIFDILTFEKGNRQLNSLSELLFKTPTHSSSPSDWVGTRVNLFFGPKLYSHSNEALLYGIGKEDGDHFVVPEYLFKIASQRMKKKFYSLAEVYKVVDLVENAINK